MIGGMNVWRTAILVGVLAPAAVTRAGDAKPPREVSSVEERALAARPGDSLLLMVGDRITVARVDRTGITSRGIHLQLTGTRLRGDVGGQHVTLDLSEGHVAGRIGAGEVSLAVSRGEASLNVDGHFGARGISLRLNPAAVTAEVGPCRYVLKFYRNEYTGQVGCGGEPEPVHLSVPASLVARGDVELAALFTSLIAR
jgi:hypothetical protein